MQGCSTGLWQHFTHLPKLGQVFLHPACPAKGAQPWENKSGRRKAGAKVKSEADSDFPESPNGGDVEGAAWQMGPLGAHGFVTPYKASQSERHARSLLPLPGDGSGITLAEHQSPPPCREGGRQGHPHACRGHRSIPSLLRVPSFLVELRTHGQSGAGQGLLMVPVWSHRGRGECRA